MSFTTSPLEFAHSHQPHASCLSYNLCEGEMFNKAKALSEGHTGVYQSIENVLKNQNFQSNPKRLRIIFFDKHT
jgi:hypothetical protein